MRTVMGDRTTGTEGEYLRQFLHAGAPAWESGDGAAMVRWPTGSLATVLLSATGEFDVDSVACLREAFDCAWTGQTERILLDVTRVEFADAAFIHELLDTRHRAGRLVLVGPVPRPVRKLLETTGHAIFSISPWRSPWSRTTRPAPVYVPLCKLPSAPHLRPLLEALDSSAPAGLSRRPRTPCSRTRRSAGR
ncbi:STAS domain-containing protein [Streptomyces flavochromogenes]|uniref:STAS domain-containing protein n=1 Tax=Streptomyces flavochromogenes TaxID=68199 RepID=UPI000B20B8C9|nr:STAS domain-containing protein [Streptomyces flavochromogenes]